ncbi:vWA domain-containing protein [Actinomadura sp. CNU-125]|uniref:vWA domain-containing protein n=1 Tax=Actinomadura sp. CNU-125 TaxID=1904961 RepID=UPI00096AB7CE|nr:VWA domain-containing protein [Actinomadura sp. CNU-125]
MDVTGTIAGFARTLRAAGGAADPERLQAMIAALRHLDVLDPSDVYWAGRLTLCAGPDDLPCYDRAFAAYFSGETARPPRRPPVVVHPTPVLEPDGDGDGSGDARAVAASPAEALRERDVSRLGAAERAEVALARRAAGRGRRTPPLAPVRARARRSPRPGPDRPETLRRGRRDGPAAAPRAPPARVVLIVDVSGSMAPYADALLRFAHAAVRSGGRTAEAFTAGTRLTRVTRELGRRDPDAAIAAASAAIPDWSGGTRLGEELREFLDRFGRPGMARGAIVVVASDGWERGDAGLLGEQMSRLHRLAHRVIWANPHKARPGYEPLTAGMAAALPHVDDFTSGHSLAALERLARLIAGTGRTTAHA